MEADSTTLEIDNFTNNQISRDRQNDKLCFNVSENSYYNQNVIPLLTQPDTEWALIEWMKENGLLKVKSKCTGNSPDCKIRMVKAKVIDKYQWHCNHCKTKSSVRDNSVFKNTGMSLKAALNIIQAWCFDMDYIYVSSSLDIKKNLVNLMYTKIEKIIASKTVEKLGGADSVVLVEMYPNGTVENHPDSSRSDSDLIKHKILCLADTKNVRTRYNLHVMTGYIKKSKENNNSVLEKVKPENEMLDFITKNVRRGGYCMIGSSSDLTKLPGLLSKANIFDGVISVETLSSTSESHMKEFVADTIWRPAVTLCESAQELPRKQMQTYLNCSLWRRETSHTDMLPHVIQLVAHQTNSHDIS